ncbi:DUF6289 family protein [Lysobacter capsici]|uniref:DUF6289 family protein n=1 Tax=Lysobacter capsici TaxID=435897 RepID=UPI000BBB649B|nr:DUF6289 family protein [Lysobacter capsici]ATE70726.1 hypothetical protein CNO08_04745 [Lysobacter capsici]
MSRLLKISLLGLMIAFVSTSAVSVPSYPPLAPGYQRDFFDDQGHLVGRWVNDCDNVHFSQWGVRTDRYTDSPTVCL